MKAKRVLFIFLIIDTIMAILLALLIKGTHDTEDIEDDSEDDIFSEECPNEEYI